MRTLLSCLLSFVFALSFIHRAECQSGKVTDFARDIMPLLREQCESCHEGEKASNGFVISQRDALLAFIEPGNSAASSLWTDYLTQPAKDQLADSLVMPPKGPLKASQLALLKLWIDEGADWPADVVFGSEASASATSAATSKLSIGIRIYRAIGYFHPAVVHFPIALFLLGGACAFFSYFLGPKCQSVAFQCVSVAAVTCIVSVIMGWAFADTQGYAAWDKGLAPDASHRDSNLYYHRWLGTSTAIAGVACVLLALVARRYKSIRLNHVWRILAMVLGLMVSIVGHQGGELVYGEIFDKAMEQLFK